jgi:predicted transcriptional regulator
MTPQTSTNRWSRLPTKWINKHKLHKFQAGKQLGVSVSGMKILLAILLHAKNNKLIKIDHMQGCATLSYDQISTLVDISRAMINKGITLLVRCEIIELTVGKGSEKNIYKLLDYGEHDQWAKISNTRLFRSPNQTKISTLYDFSQRRTNDLNALKLYLLLCATVDRKKGYAEIGYENITNKSGIPKNKIRRAISILLEHDLIKITKVNASIRGQNAPNQYHILGI